VLWILVTVFVGFIVIIVQLLLAYQKRASRLKVAQNPVRKQISDHKKKIEELAEGVRNMANEGLVQLKEDLVGLQRRSGQAANLNAELDSEAQAWVTEREDEEGGLPDDLLLEDEDEATPEDGEGEEEDDIDGIIGGRRDPTRRVESHRANPVEIVRAVRHELEETLEYIEGLRTDATIVQQSLQWLGQENEGKGKGKGKGGANGSS
jgi:hypothetical protein